MIRWLRGETVGDLCRESAHISCAMVAEGILSPFSVRCSLFILSNVALFFCQLFPFSSISCFSFLSIGYFSFLVVDGCACFLLPPTFDPVRTS